MPEATKKHEYERKCRDPLCGGEIMREVKNWNDRARGLACRKCGRREVAHRNSDLNIFLETQDWARRKV